MGPLLYLVKALLNLAVVAVDVVCFFLVVRLLSYRWSWGFLRAVNRAGTLLVDYVLLAMGRVGACMQSAQSYSPRKRLLMALALLCLARLLMGLVLGLLG